MKLVSYNIQAGIGTNRPHKYVTHAHKQLLNTAGKYKTLHKIADLISEYDIVCLQEVDLGGRRSGFASQVEFLKSKSKHQFSASQENRRIGKISRHGNAVLSNLELDNIRDLKLPGRIKGRGALIVDLDLGRPTTLACVHLSLGEADQTAQLLAIGEKIDWGRLVIVCGDMNCNFASAPVQAFCERYGAVVCSAPNDKTYPSWNPRHAIDLVITNDNHAVERVAVLRHVHSDHLPIACEWT